jgi:hypothetical protein
LRIASGVDGCAYVVTKGANHNLALPELKRELRHNPVTAVRRFSMLADGLAQLHNLGIVHRRPLGRHRMGADLLRADVGDLQEIEQRTRRIISSQDPRALPHYPQERLRLRREQRRRGVRCMIAEVAGTSRPA